MIKFYLQLRIVTGIVQLCDIVILVVVLSCGSLLIWNNRNDGEARHSAIFIDWSIMKSKEG
ncbi:MAG: hypothetical protein WBM35_07285 [Candidatus Electrothrix sp.]